MVTTNQVAMRCRELSTQWWERGRRAESLLLLERAVLTAPEDAPLVLEYAARAELLLGGEAVESRIDRLEHLEEFVRSRVLHVGLEAIDEIVACVDRIRSSRDALAASTVSGDAPDAPAVALPPAAEAPPPVDPTALEDWLRKLEAVDACATDGERHRLATALHRARAAQTFDLTVVEAKATLERLDTWKNVAREAAALQQMEATLNQLAIPAEQLGDARIAQLDAVLEKLRRHGLRVGQAARENDADERWNEFMSVNGTGLRALAFFAKPSNAEPNGACERALVEGRMQLQRLEQLFPQLGGTGAAAKALAQAKDAADSLFKISKIQQVRYDRWALGRIRQGYASANEFIRILGNQTMNLGNCLVAAFGPIDVRLLGIDVQRCFGEVFDILYTELEKPSSAESFDKSGNKLSVLSGMMNANKRPLADF